MVRSARADRTTHSSSAPGRELRRRTAFGNLLRERIRPGGGVPASSYPRAFVQRDVGPVALLRLVGGALRFDSGTFRSSAAAEGLTRLHLAVVMLAAVMTGFAIANGAVSGGVVGASEPGLYRAVILCWAIAVLLHFAVFLGIAWLLQRARRKDAPSLRVLTRLLALSLAPSCLNVFVAIAGYVPGNLTTTFIATRIGPTAFFVVGTLLGYYPDDVALVLGAWGLAIGIVALRVGTGASWLAAAATVLLAARLVGPLPEVADLVMNGVR